MKFVIINLRQIYVTLFLSYESLTHVSYVNVYGNKGNGFQHLEHTESENINTLKNSDHT